MYEVETIKLEFPGYSGDMLAARLEIPKGHVRAYAVFAHCFTCSKDTLAAKHVAKDLARVGIATLRFDFTGLGNSEGDFSQSNFTSNVLDIMHACEFMSKNYEAPSILIGHSLGGAAVLATAGQLPEVKAVATIGAPSSTKHILYLFGDSIKTIEQEGQAEVDLVGRTFHFEKQFIDDLINMDLKPRIANLKKPLMVLHSPIDQTVGIENAAEIFNAAKHPKSFISLDNANHFLTDGPHGKYVAMMISSFASRYVPEADFDPNDVEFKK